MFITQPPSFHHLLGHSAWLKPVRFCATVRLFGDGARRKKCCLVMPWHLQDLLPYCTKVGLHPDFPFCSEKDLTHIVLEEDKTPLLLAEQLFPGANPTEINSTPPASPRTAVQAFQGLTLLQCMHLEAITRPLLPVTDEQLKCA